MKQDITLVSPRTEHLTNVCNVLEHFGMSVSQAENIESVNAGLTSHSPAFLLLDEDMEGIASFLTEMPKWALQPPPYVIVAGTFLHNEGRITMLNIGADTCISKPINADEIRATINAVLRRERRIAGLHIGRLLPRFDYKDLSIDPLRRLVEMRGETVELTEKEFDILYLLAYHSEKVLTKEEIYESVWKNACVSSAASVSGHVFSLRQKLGLDPKNKDYIQTVFGVGYRFIRVE